MFSNFSSSVKYFRHIERFFNFSEFFVQYIWRIRNYEFWLYRFWIKYCQVNLIGHLGILRRSSGISIGNWTLEQIWVSKIDPLPVSIETTSLFDNLKHRTVLLRFVITECYRLSLDCTDSIPMLHRSCIFLVASKVKYLHLTLSTGIRSLWQPNGNLITKKIKYSSPFKIRTFKFSAKRSSLKWTVKGVKKHSLAPSFKIRILCSKVAPKNALEKEIQNFLAWNWMQDLQAVWPIHVRNFYNSPLIPSYEL